MDIRRLPLGLMLMVPVLLGLGVFAFTNSSPSPGPDETPTVTEASPYPTVTPSPTIEIDYTPDPGLLTAIAGEQASGAAMQADGHWWWYMAGTGWVAEDYLVYVRDADLSQPQAPSLAGLGRIAYIRDGDLWLMNADGSDQHMLADIGDPPGEPSDGYVQDLHWSPDGTMLA